LIGEKKRIVKKKIVVKKRFVAKHLSETFEKIKKGEEREIILTGLRHLLFLSHTIMKLFFLCSFLFDLWNHFVLFFIMFCSFWFEPRSTQHRSLKGSSTTHQSTKARIFQKVDSFSRVHNRMDKLTLTRQFWIQLGIFLGRYREEIEME